MKFIILFAIVQASLSDRILKRLLPAQAQLPDMPYGQNAGNDFWDELEKLILESPTKNI